MEEWMWIIWLAIFVIALFIETLGPEIISIWFAGGAIVSLIASFIPGIPWWVETIVFVVVSLALILFMRPIMKKMLKRDVVPSNSETIIGKKGEITEDITPLKSGEVMVDGTIWTAVSTRDGDTINKGTIVKVLSITGNKLIVTSIK